MTVPVERPSGGIKFVICGSPNAGLVRSTFPRAKPGAPTKVPLDEITLSCSTHVCAWVRGVKANSHKTVRPADLRFLFRIFGMKRLVWEVVEVDRLFARESCSGKFIRGYD